MPGGPTRRQFVQQIAVGGGISSLSGCLLPGISGLNRKPVPKPFTNEEYQASYSETGRWLVEGHDGGRTGRSASAFPDGDVGVAWLRRPGTNQTGATGPSGQRGVADPGEGTNPRGATAPIVGAERVYIGYHKSPNGSNQPDAYLAGLDADSGELQLDVQLGSGRVDGLALADDVLIVVARGSENEPATLSALTRDDGTNQWTDTIPNVTGPPAVVDRTCYLATLGEDNSVYAYSLDGTRQWRTPLEGECYTATCADHEGVYVGLTDGRIAALDSRSGELQWIEQIATPDECCPDIQGTPTVTDGRLYVPGITRELVAADAADGTVLWRTTVIDGDYGNAVPSPAVTGETAYVNTHHGGLVAVDISDGSIRWRSVENGDNQPPAVSDGGIVVPRDDSVLAFDGTGRLAWKIDITVPDLGGGMGGYVMDTEVALAHGMCYVGIADGRIYAIGARE